MSGCLLDFLSRFPALLTEESEMGNANILIIEDDEDIREGIRILLESEDYQITEAADGWEGLRLLSDDTDLVILDIMMPGGRRLSDQAVLLRGASGTGKGAASAIPYLPRQRRRSITAGGTLHRVRPFPD